MKKMLLLFVVVSFLQPQIALSQSRKKAETEFVKQLNIVLKNSLRQHSFYEGTMTIDSAFAIHKQGLLSVTVRYTNNTGFKRVRLEVPVGAIRTVRYDLYLILECANDMVTIFESEPGSEELKEVNRGAWLYVGAPLPEDVVYQQRVQKALDNVTEFYKN